MNYTINDLTKHFEVKKEEAALLFIFLTLLPPGEVFEAFNGTIRKLSETAFELCIDTKTLYKIADDFLIEGNDKDDYNQIFANTREKEEEPEGIFSS